MLAAFAWLKATRWAQVALGGILAVLAFLWWLDGVKDKAVEQDRAKAAAAVAAEKEAAAERLAEQSTKDAARNARADQRNADAIARAQASYPAEVRKPAGPATRAVLEGLRR